MDIYVTEDYPLFRCTAGACKHNCCIGWEIDIDKDSAACYRKTEGAFGEKLRQNIEETNEIPHFKLSDNGRCPFLTKDNLCEIYIRMGEEALCGICTDHPRYRNFYSFGVEMGLGACCEEAARLILAWKKPPKFVLLSGDGERKPSETETRFFDLRQSLFDMAFDESMPPKARADKICEAFSLSLPREGLFELYDGLTTLRPSWKEKIKRLKIVETPSHYTYFPQLFSYFLCRHFAGGLTDGRLTARLLFALHAADVILRISAHETEVEAVFRAYAEEIEYAEENMETILDFLA